MNVRAAYYLLEGYPHDLHVRPQRAVVYVPDIKAELLCPADGVAPMALSPAAEAGAHLVAAVLVGRVERKILHQQRARANQGHVTFEDVEQLGQFVYRGGTDEAAYSGEALGIGQEMAGGVALVRHGLELDDFEYLLMQTGPFLQEESPSAPVCHMQPYGDEEQQPAYQQQSC